MEKRKASNYGRIIFKKKKKVSVIICRIFLELRMKIFGKVVGFQLTVFSDFS